MFAGIVETKSTVVKAEERPGLVRVFLKRPQGFSDIQLGDSIACDGVCLTVEQFDDETLKFALGPETLRVTGWSSQSVLGKVVNLERSLRLGDRIHGHLVTGHVDARGRITSVQTNGETVHMQIEFPETLKPYIWPKGSIAVNGVSLTINGVGPSYFEVGLIPETLKRTNLDELKAGDGVNLEIDNMARGLIHIAKLDNV